MWFRDREGKMRQVIREDFYTDSEYYNFIANLFFKNKI
jgi:hypothetical protein